MAPQNKKSWKKKRGRMVASHIQAQKEGTKVKSET